MIQNVCILGVGDERKWRYDDSYRRRSYSTKSWGGGGEWDGDIDNATVLVGSQGTPME